MSPAVGPYAPVRRVGDLVVTSGQLGLDPRVPGAPTLVPGGTGPELSQALANLDDVLGREGCGPADVVKATVFLVDMADFALVNELWVAHFALEPRPARSVVAVAALPLGARVEVEAWAQA